MCSRIHQFNISGSDFPPTANFFPSATLSILRDNLVLTYYVFCVIGFSQFVFKEARSPVAEESLSLELSPEWIRLRQCSQWGGGQPPMK